MDRTHRQDGWENVNVFAFCQQVGREYMPRMRRQGIQLEIEGDAGIWSWIPADRVRQILAALVEDSLEAMPRGGELDLIIIPVAGGVEIEVADSREVAATELPECLSAGELHAEEESAAQPVSDQPDLVRLQTQPCPQGGVARTLNISHHPFDPETNTTTPYRRAA